MASRRSTTGASLALLTVLAGCGGEGPAPPEGPFVTESVLGRALESEVPARLPLTDEIEFFERRLNDDPTDLIARRGLVRSSQLRFRGYGTSDDLARAESVVSSLLVRDDYDFGALSARATIDLAKHRFEAAVAAAERGLAVAGATDAGDAARLRLFDTYLAAGRYGEAERQLDLVGERRVFSFLVREARLLDRLGRVEDARDRMERAVELARAYAQPPVVQAWSLVELGHFEHHSGRPDRAVTRYLEALDVAPGYPAALEGLGEVAYAVDLNLDAAEQLFRKSLSNGGHLDLYGTLIEIALEQGDAYRAGDYGRVLLEAARGNAEEERLYRRPLALLLAEQANGLHDALRLARADLGDRRSAETVAVYAWVLHRTGESARAQVLFEHALAWGVPEPMVYELAGRAAVDAGEAELGTELLTIALESESEIGPHRARKVREALRRVGSAD